jgi:hypothetical protein
VEVTQAHGRRTGYRSKRIGDFRTEFRMQGDVLPVDKLEERADRVIEPELLLDPLPAAFTQATAQLSVVQEVFDGFGQRLVVPRLDQEPGDVMLDQLAPGP